MIRALSAGAYGGVLTSSEQDSRTTMSVSDEFKTTCGRRSKFRVTGGVVFQTLLIVYLNRMLTKAYNGGTCPLQGLMREEKKVASARDWLQSIRTHKIAGRGGPRGIDISVFGPCEAHRLFRRFTLVHGFDGRWGLNDSHLAECQFFLESGKTLEEIPGVELPNKYRRKPCRRKNASKNNIHSTNKKYRGTLRQRLFADWRVMVLKKLLLG